MLNRGAFSGSALVRWSCCLAFLACLVPWATVAVAKEEKSVKVECSDSAGTATFNSGVSFVKVAFKGLEMAAVQTTTGISLVYKGTNCSACRWLQFAWREATGTINGKDIRVTPTVKYNETTGSYPFTDDTTMPEYHVDSPSKTDPNYPGQEVGADSVTITDDPSPTLRSKAPATKMTETIHLDAYLICAKKVCAHFSWTRTWTSTPGGDEPGSDKNPGVTQVGAADNAAPSQRMIDELNKEYPGQTVLPK